MSRKKTGSFTRDLIPEGRYGSLIATKFINCLMFSGKKSISEGIFYEALDKMTAKVKAEGISPIELFNQAIENVKPLVEVKSRRVGGANYQVPVEVRPERPPGPRPFRWILDASRARGEKTMAERLGNELSDAYQQDRQRDQEARRRPPHGRSQQGLRPLPLVVRWGQKVPRFLKFCPLRARARNRNRFGMMKFTIKNRTGPHPNCGPVFYLFKLLGKNFFVALRASLRSLCYVLYSEF